MSFLRQYVAPFFIVVIFLVAMVAVSARIWLPSDLAAPAPIEEPSALNPHGDHTASTMAATVDRDMTLAQFYPVVSDEDTDTTQHG